MGKLTGFIPYSNDSHSLQTAGDVLQWANWIKDEFRLGMKRQIDPGAAANAL